MHVSPTSWKQAIEKRDVEACRALIAQGADVNAVIEFGETPLHQAVKFCDLDLLKLLIEAGAKVNVGCEFGHAPLHEAFIYMDYPAADFLLAHGADLSFVPENPRDTYVTPFQLLVRTNRPEQVRHYALTQGVDLGQRTVKQITLLQLAGKPEMRECLRSLKIEMAVGDGISKKNGAVPVRRVAGGMSPI